MIIRDWLSRQHVILTKEGIATARLDRLVLLEDVLGKDRTHLLAYPLTELTNEQEKILNEQIARRVKHEPLAYIRGKSEFYGREFNVTGHTLEPRPETETLIEMAKQLVKETEPFTVADIGTGSGCIAISIKLELPNTKVYATDIDEKCVETAQQNAQKLKADITVLQGNLLEPFKNQVIDVLLCNLPYVPTKYELNKAAQFEPKHAIFGGDDGLGFYRQLFNQIDTRQQKPQQILTEALPFQHKELAVIAKNSHYRLEMTDDFIQLFTLQNSSD